MLCNTLIQSHFDYECLTWYPNLTETNNRKNKLCKINAHGFALDSIKCII